MNIECELSNDDLADAVFSDGEVGDNLITKCREWERKYDQNECSAADLFFNGYFPVLDYGLNEYSSWDCPSWLVVEAARARKLITSVDFDKCINAIEEVVLPRFKRREQLVIKSRIERVLSFVMNESSGWWLR